MSCSICLVSEAPNYLWGSPHSTSCPGKMWWLLLWGVLQAWPTQGSVLLAQQLPQQLTSPGYPEPYLKGQESTTVIEAPEGFAVKLIFQDFDVEPSQDCEQDSVTITANGVDPSRFCGQQGSQLGNPPGQREFVSSGNSLQLTFHAPTSSEVRTTGLHTGFLALYQAVSVSHSRPVCEVSGSSEATYTPGDNSSMIQNHCQEPYYQPVPAGTLTCKARGPGKETQDRDEAPRCAPGECVLPVLWRWPLSTPDPAGRGPVEQVCGQPVTPIAQNQEAQASSKAKLGNFPWQAFTSIYGRGGGALLGNRWILTAAHTLYPKDSIFSGKRRRVDVFLGHTDIDELMKLGSHPVHRVVVHPDYRQNESYNFNGDIALLELQHSVPLGPHLLPVCLPNNETLYRSGLMGYVSGFGVEMGWLTTELKYSRLPVAPREACEAWLRKKQRTDVFSDNMFCVGDEMRQQNVCQGDSGGVYVVWDDRSHHWVATGIVSWGIGCGKGYGFYTKVLNYVDWIKGVMDGKD